jgi:hypothetical protein
MFGTFEIIPPSLLKIKPSVNLAVTMLIIIIPVKYVNLSQLSTSFTPKPQDIGVELQRYIVSSHPIGLVDQDIFQIT